MRLPPQLGQGHALGWKTERRPDLPLVALLPSSGRPQQRSLARHKTMACSASTASVFLVCNSVRRILTVIVAVGWNHPDALLLREARRLEIAEEYGREGSEPAGSEARAEDVAIFLVAYDKDTAVGCGALRILEENVGEIKRMFVQPAMRGSGVSTAILRALEAWAGGRGVQILKLETGDRLLAAQRFYEREGFLPVEPFGPYVGSDLSRCYEKVLTTSARPNRTRPTASSAGRARMRNRGGVGA